MAINPELSSFPEELLERILALCVSAPPFPPPRPSWHQPSRPPPSRASTLPNIQAPAPTSAPTRSRTAPLLVSKQWLRISTPLFYHTLLISSPAQAARLHTALRRNPSLAPSVRRLVALGVWPELAELIQMCDGIDVLDLTLDAGSGVGSSEDSPVDKETDSVCSALQNLDVKHLIVRKSPNVYLTQPKPRALIAGIARAVQNWTRLETTHIAFRLSDDPSSPTLSPTPAPAPPQPQPHLGPISLLTHALRAAPHLHTVSTHLPSLWNTALLTISANPALARVTLEDPAHGGAIVGTGLFLMQARKHQRLGELIRAGTPIIRTRAHTMGTVTIGPNVNANIGGGVSLGAACCPSSDKPSSAPPAPTPRSASASGSLLPTNPNAGSAQRRWEM